jgi:hypothetical protein
MVKSLAEVSASRVTARHPECGSMSNLAVRCDPQTDACISSRGSQMVFPPSAFTGFLPWN